MSTIHLDEDAILRIPASVVDLASFRRWVHSDDFPEQGRICFLNGEVWVDMSKEQVFWHTKVKGEFFFVLSGLVKSGQLGHYLGDGLLLSNAEADFTSQPDGTFVSHKSLETGNARWVEGRKAGYLELEGTPDMVLEVVSDSSVKKDTITLRELYGQAGIREYWLVDVRGERLAFDILRHTARGYRATRKQGGWLESAVFGKSFRLTRRSDPQGNPEYPLEVR